ncbi:DUF6090 family protein [Eudoraea adriatica]|uniref:DUF6090 family protein n=1 Tax=Eudoraea adriatica TaxID=446681 RepID=UPI00039C6D77|nr:DUF6090 family protein [Eudoraea adriatica]
MLRFFRQIRQRLLTDNPPAGSRRADRFSKYLLYALGEILLVVIGILIALSINNWNEGRIAKIQEKSVLSNLNREFLQNKKALIQTIHANEEAFKSGLELMKLMGKDKSQIVIVNTDSLIFQTVEFFEFTPSENSLSDLLQSGRLQLLENETVKDLLYEWSRGMALAKGDYETFDSSIEDDLLPYLTKHYSMKDVDMYGNLNWKSKSDLKNDKLKIFEDIEFENLMDDMLYRLLKYNNSLKKALLVIDNILKESGSE